MRVKPTSRIPYQFNTTNTEPTQLANRKAADPQARLALNSNHRSMYACNVAIYGMHTLPHSYTCICVYIYIHVSVCACVCVHIHTHVCAQSGSQTHTQSYIVLYAEKGHEHEEYEYRHKSQMPFLT